MKKNTVITISRQYGSGGRQISRLVSEKMGVKRYDRTVVAMAAESLGAGDRLEDGAQGKPRGDQHSSA